MQFTDFTKPEADRLKEFCNFTDDEKRIFELRCSGKSIVAVALKMFMSERTVNRIIARIKRKIQKVI